MSQLYAYVAMLAIISIVGILFRKTTTPMGLLLVVAGIILSLFEQFPRVELEPQLVLNVFLPVPSSIVFPLTLQVIFAELISVV